MQVAEDACIYLEDELLFCEVCRLYFHDSCPQHGPPTFVIDTPVPETVPSRALLSLPEGLLVKERSQGGFGVWSTLPILSPGCIFGPYEGQVVENLRDCTVYSWLVQNKESYFFIDASDDSKSNWMRYVAFASTEGEQNLTVFQYRGRIYYRVCQVIPAGTELVVWIGEDYAFIVGLHLGEHFKYKFGKKEFQELHVTAPSPPPDPHTPSSTQHPCEVATTSSFLHLHKPGLPVGASTFPLVEGIQNLVGLSRAQSLYWTFFGFQEDAYGRILDKSKIICKVCGDQLSYSGDIANLRQHLIFNHCCEYVQFLKVQVNNLNKGIGEFGTPHSLIPGQTTQAIAYFIVLDLMPVEVVEGQGFGQMLAVLNPDYQSPGAASLVHTVLKDMYTQVKGNIWEQVRALPQCSLSLDIWCHSSTLTYLTLTVHYVDDCFEPQARVLSSHPIPENPSTESLVEFLTEATKEWGIHRSILYTMGGIGPAFQQAAAALGWTALPCIGQVLQAAMEAVLNQPMAQSALENLRHLASWTLSTVGQDEKLWFQEPLLQAHLSRFLRDGSRWYSVYSILQDLLEYRRSLSGLGPDGEAILHPQDWAALKDTVQVLKPMAIATSTFTKHPFSSLSLVKPVLTGFLYTHLAASEWDSALTLEAKAAAQNELNHHFSRPEVNQALNLACAVDPRFHGLDFLSHSDQLETLNLLQTKVCHLAETSGFLTSTLPDVASPSPSSKLPKQDFEFLLGDLCSMHRGPGISSAHQQAEQEIINFQMSKASALIEDPLQWWKIHHTQYPLLAQAARNLLGVPATSVPSDWLFSSTGDAIYSKRQALTPEHVDMLVFLHGNHAMLY